MHAGPILVTLGEANMANDDEEIQRRVLDDLRWVPEVEPTDIGVEVDDGVVTLTGTVDSYPMKIAAERVALRLAGVKAVANDIQVELPFERIRDDTDIARAAATALEWDTRVPDERVRVSVRDGWVILEGDVFWQYQREAAADAVRNLTGVKGVTNLITISTPKVPAEEAKSKIEEALKRSVGIDAVQIQVDVKDGKATLSGSVRSPSAREEAEKAAWSARGIWEVENRIAVAP